MITKHELIGFMSAELLTEARMASVRREAMEANPTAYSANESEQILMTQYRNIGRVIQEMGVESHRSWGYNTSVGAVWYDED